MCSLICIITILNGLLFALGLLQPGRVATLIDDPHSQTHGVAFQLLGDSALEYLNNREVTLGGYVNHMTTFYPAADATTDNVGAARNPFPVLLFMATPSNEQWLGSAPLEDIAEQVRLWLWFVKMGTAFNETHNMKPTFM